MEDLKGELGGRQLRPVHVRPGSGNLQEQGLEYLPGIACAMPLLRRYKQYVSVHHGQRWLAIG